MCENRKTVYEERIERICRLNRFSTYIVLNKSKKILNQYRDAQRGRKLSSEEEEQIIKRLKIAAKNKYEQTYIKKQGEQTGSIDYLLMEVLGTSWTDGIMKKVFDKMEHFDPDCPYYSEIIKCYFINEERMDDVDIQVAFDIGRAFYYRMKKAAIILFGISLWDVAVEECVKCD